MTINDPFDISPIFAWNYNCDKQIVINQGGSSSGKTYSLLQLLLVKAQETPNQIITVVGQDVPNLKVGAIRTFETIVSSNPFFTQMIKAVNRTDKIYHLHNGSKIEFKSFADEQDAKGGRRDYLFVNEANGISYDIFDQLNIRTSKQVFIDYNPSSPFWAHSELMGRKDVQFFRSWYIHNINLSKQIIGKIEAYRDNPSYAEKWRVYGLGKTGKTEGVIFKHVNWLTTFPEDVKRISYGMDFGFTNDPTTLVKCGLSDGELFAERWMYEHGMTTNDIHKALQDLRVSPKDSIYADSADPKTIKELKLLGWNIRGAKKGADSIRHGIDNIKKYNALNIVNCKHWKMEQISYIWGVDKKTSKPTNKPIDNYNHLWDALRYGIQGLTKRKAKTTVR
jgi:phage terminase large subunit